MLRKHTTLKQIPKQASRKKRKKKIGKKWRQWGREIKFQKVIIASERLNSAFMKKEMPVKKGTAWEREGEN